MAFSADGRLASGSGDNTVKIWDPATGHCLQTLEIGTKVSTLSFDVLGLYFSTDTSTILLDDNLDNNLDDKIALSATSTHRLPPQPQQPCYRGTGISSDGIWITWNGENVLWLPPDYRPSCSAIAESAVAIGCRSGRVLIFQVTFDGTVSFEGKYSVLMTT